MNNIQKKIKYVRQSLINRLYPTNDIIKFISENLYQELLEIISLDCCISEDNLNKNVRDKNLEFVRGVIKGFVFGNVVYQKVLYKHYKYDDMDDLTRDILIGFVLYASTLSEEFNDIDIINDQQSILYGETFILDLVE